jgi:hypothetical protein
MKTPAHCWVGAIDLNRPVPRIGLVSPPGVLGEPPLPAAEAGVSVAHWTDSAADRAAATE